MKSSKHKTNPLMHDFIMIMIGIVLAIILVETGLLNSFINLFQDYYIVSSFIAGIFFTSVFTIAPSSVVLVRISEYAPINGIILWGALGAMCGDMILFFFIRDRFAEDVMSVIKPKTIHHILKSIHLGFLKWLSPVVGALIIASPLPDEFGIALLGMSKIKTSLLIPIAFIMNMLGIYLVIQFSNLL